MSENKPADQIQWPVSKEFQQIITPAQLEALKKVPTSLESIFQIGGDSKTAWDSLSVILGAHKPDSLDVMERTRLDREDVILTKNVLMRCINGPGIVPKAPNSFWLPEGVLDVILFYRAMVSLGGESRKEYVEAFSSANTSKFKVEQPTNPMKSA